jgi:uncharacterized protein (TIGR03067 family)
MSQANLRGYRVFISYSSHDRGWAEAVCARLEARGVRCWIAPRDITPGTEWGAAIIEGIDRCPVMVLIFSSRANASAQVRREVERALGKGLAILPVRVEDARPEGAMEYALSNTHWLDAFAPPTEGRMAHLVDSVEALLGRRPTAPPPTPAPAPTPPPTPVADPGDAEEEDGGGVVDPRPGWGRWAWAAAAGGLALLAVVAAVVLPGLGRAAPDDKGRGKPGARAGAQAEPSPGDFVDVTGQFAGRWAVVREHRLVQGPVPKAEVAEEQGWWGIRGNAMRWHRETTDGAVDIDGTIHFRAAGDVRYLEFEGGDGRRHTAVHGIYEFRDGVLKVCFRSTARPRPTEFPSPEDRGVNALTLVRARGPGPGGRRGGGGR